MKTLKLLSLTILASLTLSSCSNNEDLLPEAKKTDSLKSYKVQRDASGAYSIEYDLEKNTRAEKLINSQTNTNEFHLFETDFTSSKRNSDQLFTDDNMLSISFLDTKVNKRSNITIEDEPTSFEKSDTKIKKMLSEYSVTSKEDDIFNLVFKVNKNVSVDFVYNEKISTYEIHLEKGKSNGTTFSRDFQKLEGEILRIDFVNHTKNNSAKGDYLFSSKRKPKIIIVDSVVAI